MKPSLCLLLFFFIQLNFVNCQDQPFKCNYSDWAENHNENNKFNSLIDSACVEINTHRYEIALGLLNEAVALSAADNGGDPNLYIEAQQRKLAAFINDQKGSNNDDSLEITSDSDSVQQPNDTVLISPIDTIHVTPPIIPPVEGDSKPTPPQINTGEAKSLSFTMTELDEFRTKGEQKIKQFEEYYYQIASKSSTSSAATQAIENAVLLFDKEDRTIQVSSINRSEKPKYKIRIYLQRVRNLNYEEIKVDWADFQYASEFTKGRDGNYYAYVVFSQRFMGIRDNKVVYEDVTQKRQEIILKRYEKELNGEMIENWDVLLGDMSVVQTSEN